jgi:hypothetical protein
VIIRINGTRKESSDLEDQRSRAKQSSKSTGEGIAVHIEQIFVLVGVFPRRFTAGDVELLLDSRFIALRLRTVLTHESRERKVGEIGIFLRE